MQRLSKSTLVFALSALVIVSLTRFIPHWPNFTALGAVAIFSGAVLSKNKLLSFSLPIVLLFLTDLVVNNYIYGSFYEGFVWLTPGALFIYGGFISMIFFADIIASNKSVGRIAGATGAGTISFFLITNFGAWLANPLYPKSIQGLMSSYAAGLPFLASSAAANVVYSALLFGAYFYAQTKIPKLQEARVKS